MRISPSLSTLLAVSAVTLAALSGPADSRPLQNAKLQVAQKPPQKPVQHKPVMAQRQPAPREAVRDLRSLQAQVQQAGRPQPASLSDRGRPAFGWPALIVEARKYMGTNPTARTKLWCATFMNMILAKTGYAGTGSDAAKSFASYGKRISEPRVGAIAVLTRGKRGGHVGIVTGLDDQGNPIIISGNHNKRVGEARYNRSRVIAYVMPTSAQALGPGAPRPAADAEAGLSPIHELLAAINAERERRRAAEPVRVAQPQPQPAAPPQRVAHAPPPAAPQRAVQAPPAAQPQRVAQQTPPQPDSRRVQQMDPALATFLGVRDTERERPVLRVNPPQQVAADRNRVERVFFAR